MKRFAFTMIELIFVIVILGILAAVAIPRLSATRDDAMVSRMAHMITTGVNEVAAYAVANANTDQNFSDMSSNFEMLLNSGEAQMAAPKEMKIAFGGVGDCIVVDVNSTATTEVLNITLHNSGVSSLCDALQNVINVNEYPMLLRGESIER